MRKIKTCICDSTKRIKADIGNPILSICLSHFLLNMAGILLLDSDYRLKTDYPDIEISGEKISGKAKEHLELMDYLSVLHQYDLSRNMAQFTQLQGFLSWFLEQDEPNNEDLIFWYDKRFLVDKWNEYANSMK